MKPTRYAPLVGLLVVVALVTLLLTRQFYTELPLLPWTAIPTVLLLALGEFVAGWHTKARIARVPGSRPVEPLAVARLAALAKASAYAGVVLAGAFGGFALYTVRFLANETPRREFFIATGTFLASVLLVVAALCLEYACRVPKRPDEEREKD